MNEVTVRDVAGKRRPIEQQHFRALPGNEHGKCRSGTPCPDDDDVEHDRPRKSGPQDSRGRFDVT
jgi:hypothetical protein